MSEAIESMPPIPNFLKNMYNGHKNFLSSTFKYVNTNFLV